jgi:hypothetical protein
LKSWPARSAANRPSIFKAPKKRLRKDGTTSSVLEFAAEEERILVSHDVSTMPIHFAEIMTQRASSPGVILLPQSMPIGDAIDEIILIWAASDASEWRNKISWLPL